MDDEAVLGEHGGRNNLRPARIAACTLTSALPSAPATGRLRRPALVYSELSVGMRVDSFWIVNSVRSRTKYAAGITRLNIDDNTADIG
jgi:hypothetical protein